MDSDIEVQLPNKQMEDREVPADSSHPPHQQQHHPAAGSSRKSCLATLYLIIVMVLCILYAAIVLSLPVSFSLICIIIFSFPKKTVKKLWKPELDISSEEGIGGVYQRSRRKETLADRIELTSLQIIARVSLAMLVGLALSLWIPRLRTTTLLGSPLWKWSSLGVTLTAAYFEAAMVTVLIFFHIFARKKTAPYYRHASVNSLIAVAYFGMVLASWLLYFGTEQGLKQASTPHPQAFEYVTWTIVSLCVGSLLWLLKALLLARWSADAIYRRFEPRILITSVKFSFIGLSAAGFFAEGIFSRIDKVLDECGGGGGKTEQRRTSVTKYIMSRKTELFYLRNLSLTLMSLAELMSQLLELQGEEEKDGIDQVANWFQHHTKGAPTDKCGHEELLTIFEARLAKPPSQTEPSSDEGAEEGEPKLAEPKFCEILSALHKSFCQYWNNSKEDDVQKEPLAHLLCRIVQEERSPNAFTFEDLNKWMVFTRLLDP